jgi:hypothetical protein
MANKKSQTQDEKLQEFRGRFSSFLRPGTTMRQAKIHQVPPARRISQDRLAAVEHLRRGILASLEAYELGQATLADDVRRGVPVAPGKLTATLGKNGKGNEVVIVSGVAAVTFPQAGRL